MPSSAIRDFAYDAAAAVLDVTFVGGRRYRYFAVPPQVARGLQEAPSRGSFFNATIRDRFGFEERRRARQG